MILRKPLAASLVVAGVVMLPTVVFAASDVPPPQGLETGADSLFSIDASIVAIILGTIIPIVNGVLTKLTTSTGVKAVLTLILSAVVGLINTALTDGGDAVFSKALVLNAALSFVFAIASYAGFWRPWELTSSWVSKVADDGTPVKVPGKLANVGIK